MSRFPFDVIPVIDIKNGNAVHAVGGRRAHYQPVQSILHRSCDPIALARAFRDSLGSESIYLADLDAIAGSPPNLAVYRALITAGLHLWVDAGITDTRSAAPLFELEPARSTIVAGLESLAGRGTLAALRDRAGADRVVFSLDLFDGSPRISGKASWGTDLPHELADAAIDCGVRRLLLLDLSRVGTGRGPGSDQLMARIRADHPSVQLIVGGGISGIEEVLALRDAGAWGVLVGSAIHDGRIGARELEQLNTERS
jgi:phosphoribosylformimino-5-aminoimidazole carboxamide ribotide isomerase